MRVAVLGLWHLGCVTAACLAEAGHSVTGFDPDPRNVAALAACQAPIAEPALPELLAKGIAAKALRFTHDLAEALRDAEIVWVSFDTPVDDNDVADVGYVERQVDATFPHLKDQAIVISSSQLPVGTVRKMEARWSKVAAGRSVSFACLPENLRLGAAIARFRNPDRVVAGVRDDRTRERLTALIAPITQHVEWMSVESAEMTKHAVNAFLATSVVFINELSGICEPTGADAKEVERGLRTEQRIGPRAYLSPGAAFAGGTLARDLRFLCELGGELHAPTALLAGVLESNEAHGMWAGRRLRSELGPLSGVKVAVWGLTYTPDTSTLRRSGAIALCRWLIGEGASVHAHDPSAEELPRDLNVTRHSDPIAAAAGARALVVATPWSCYRDVDFDRLATAAPNLLILDAARFLTSTIGSDHRFRVIAVGEPTT